MSYVEFCSAAKELMRAFRVAMLSGTNVSIKLVERDFINLVIDNPEHAERYLRERGEV